MLVSTCLPWSCKSAAVAWAARWTLAGSGGERPLGLAIFATMLVLVAALLLEMRTRRSPAAPGLVILLAALSLASLGVVAFSDLLPERLPDPNAIFSWHLPRPIENWSGGTRLLVRAVLLLPPIAWAAWIGVARSRALSPLAARWIASHCAAAQVMLWFSWSDGNALWVGGFGPWLSALASAAMLATAAMVDDAPPSISRNGRRALALATLALLLCMAALAWSGHVAMLAHDAARSS